jgi:hypothetical protein
MADISEPMSPTTSPASPAPKKKKKCLLLLLLLLLFGGSATTWVVLKREPPPKLPAFTQQGETEIHAGNIVMKVWDSEAEDGDVIQVYFKGKLVADNLAILNTPVEYKLGYLSRGEYLIGVNALDEGSSSPASVHISLSDGKAENEFGMDASLEKAASWKVVVK